jgi:hypothetical protein
MFWLWLSKIPSAAKAKAMAFSGKYGFGLTKSQARPSADR